MSEIRILAFAGSARTESFNKKVVSVAAAGAEKAGGTVTYIDLRDYPMPLYDGDLETESGLPENALKMKQLIHEHHGLLISTPEYNSAIPPLLKNVIDWCSRPAESNPELSGLAPFAEKTGALLGASPGPGGGIRALPGVRQLLQNIGITMVPRVLAVGSVGALFVSGPRVQVYQARTMTVNSTRECTERRQQFAAHIHDILRVPMVTAVRIGWIPDDNAGENTASH